MPADQGLCDRLVVCTASVLRRLELDDSEDTVSTKKMFGGYSVLLHDAIIAGVCGPNQGGNFFVKCGKPNHERALQLPYAREWDFCQGRSKVGWVTALSTCTDEEIEGVLEMGIATVEAEGAGGKEKAAARREKEKAAKKNKAAAKKGRSRAP